MLNRIGIVFCVANIIVCNPHVHKFAGSKESTDHGAFSPWDNNHYKDGKHDNEFDHEAILGSHGTSEEFNHLPPEEAKKRLFSLALKMDSNEDKYVDRDELINWILKSFKSLTEEEAMEDLEAEDGDEDGKVTWEEHLAETYGLFGDDMTPDQMEDLQMLEYDRALFRAADLNEDGILDKSEYPAFSHSEEFHHMHQAVYEQAMHKRDADRDGFLNLEEFLVDHRGSSPVPTTEHYALEKDRFERDFDLDHDGKLNQEEVLLWLIPNNIETAENEADHLIESSDSDLNGVLSFQEIVDHHDIFVGSEATDFGEQLHRDEL